MRIEVKSILTFLAVFCFVSTAEASVSRGGDDAGNGGFAYKQSIRILEAASKDVIDNLENIEFSEFENNPGRRELMLSVLSYENILQLPQIDGHRGTRRLAMDYRQSPPAVKIYKAYYESFAGTLNEHLLIAIKEVKRRLIHEVSHIWGYNELQAEEFATEFLRTVDRSIQNPPDRPNIKISNDYCICRKRKVISGNNCANFCAVKDSVQMTLFAKIHSSETQELRKWCSWEMSDRHISPSCWLRVENNFDTYDFPVNIKANNQIEAVLSSLSEGVPHHFRLESTTGASSNKINFTLNSSPVIVRSLFMDKVNSYYCQMPPDYVNDPRNYSQLYRDYTFYNERFPPIPLDFNYDFLYCHDRTLYGHNDGPGIPRLGDQYALKVWSDRDPYLADFDNDQRPDIEKIMEAYMRNNWNIDMRLKLFHPIPRLQGFFLNPFMDYLSGKNFCPTSNDYNGEDPLMKIVGGVVGIDTEKIFLAEREALYDPQGGEVFSNRIMIRKSDLKRVWYYIKSGLFLVPTEDDSYQKQLFFNWPLDFENPLVKRSDQRRYKLISPREARMPDLGNSSTPDKSFGCIPISE